MEKSQDLNLLFAVLAVQLKGVSADRLMEAGAAWMVNPEKPLSERVQEMGLLKPDDVTFLNRLVDQTVEACGGDPSVALNTIHGGRVVAQSIVSHRAAKGTPPHTRLMEGDISFELPEMDLSTLKEDPGRYSQVSEYGKGGMGRVLLVHDEYLGREIALKELLVPHDVDDPSTGDSPVREAGGFLARFLQEARITGQLEHPSIVPVYELGRRLNGTFYYTMKLVRGRTLSRAIKEAFNLKQRLELLPNLLDLCQAIAYAHSRGVIHRDLKPANAMIGEFGETVLLDWGLAKIKGAKDVYAGKLQDTLRLLRLEKPDHTPRTQAGEALGTPHYMPPEQAKGEIEDLDERSDVYSMGALIYEVLTGRPPFDGNTAEDILLQVVGSNPTPVEEIEPDCPPELIAICAKAMAKDRDDRYHSMLELRDDLLRFQTGAFVRSYRYNLWETLTRYYAQYRIWVNATAAAALILILMGIYSYVNILQARNRERDQRIIAEAAEEKASREAYVAQIRLAQAQINENAFDNAVDTLFATSPDEREWEWGYLLNQASPEALRLEFDSTVAKTAYSPDGNRLLVLTTGAGNYMHDAHTGARIAKLQGTDVNCNAIEFEAGGKRIVGATVTGEGRIWDAQDGTLLKTLVLTPKKDRELLMSAEFSHDGTSVLLCTSSGVATIWDAATGERLKSLRSGVGGAHGAYFGRDDQTVLFSGYEHAEVWGVAEAARRYTLKGSRAKFNADRSRVISTSGSSVLVWDARSGEQRQKLEAGRPVRLAYMSPNGRYVAATVAGADLVLLHTDTGEIATTIDLGFAIVDAAFSPDSSRIMAVSHGYSPYSVWDTATGDLIDVLPAHGQVVRRVTFSPDSRRATVSSVDGKVWTWVVGQTPAEHVQARIQGTVADGAFTADSTRGAVALKNEEFYADQFFVKSKEVLALDLQQRKVEQNWIRVGLDTSQAIALSGNGDRLAFTLDRFSIGVFDARDGSLVSALREHDGAVKQFAMNWEGTRVASVAFDGTCRIWDANTGTETQVVREDSDSFRCVDLSSDGTRAVIGTIKGRLIVLDADTGQRVKEFQAHEAIIHCVRFDGGGTRMVSGDGRGEARIWDVASGAPVGGYSGQRAEIAFLTVGSNPSRVLSAGLRGVPRLWSMETGDELCAVNYLGGRELDTSRSRPMVRSTWFYEPEGGLCTLTSDGVLTSWVAAPEDIVSGGDAREKIWQHFEQWKAEELARREPIWFVNPSPDKTVITSDRVLKRCLERLAQAADTNDTGTIRDGWRIDGRAAGNAGRRICLEPGDVITHIGGEEIRSARDVVARATALAASVQPGDKARPMMRFKRGGEEVAFAFLVLPHRETTRQVDVTNEEALKMVRHEIQALSDNKTTMHESSLLNASVLGEAGDGMNALNGAWVLFSNDKNEAQILRRLGMGLGDRMMALNGKPITSIDEAIVYYQQLEKRLERGEVSSLVLDVERGEFMRFAINLAVR